MDKNLINLTQNTINNMTDTCIKIIKEKDIKEILNHENFKKKQFPINKKDVKFEEHLAQFLEENERIKKIEEMESFPKDYFKMNISNNSSPENDKKINFNFSNSPNTNYKFPQEDDEYYLNRLFSFSDEEKEDEKIFPFPFPFCDFDEDKKIDNSHDISINDNSIKMDISKEQDMLENNLNDINY